MSTKRLTIKWPFPIKREFFVSFFKSSVNYCLSGNGKIYSDAMQDWLDGEGYNLADYGDFGECDVSEN